MAETSLHIPYLRGSNNGTFTIDQMVANYGDSYTATGTVGINPKKEEWDITTIPMEIEKALCLKDLLEAQGTAPFYWCNHPPGGCSQRYWIPNRVIQWQPKGTHVSLAFKVESYRGI